MSATPYFAAGSKQRALNARTRKQLIARQRSLSPARAVSPSLRSTLSIAPHPAAAVGTRGKTFRYEVATVWGDSRSTGRVGAANRAGAEAIVRSLYPSYVLKSLEAITDARSAAYPETLKP